MADIKHDRPQEFGSFAAWVGSGVRRRWRAIVWTFVVTYTLLPVVILVTVVLLVVVVWQRLFGGGGSTTVDPVTGAVVHAAGPSLGSAFVLFPVALISTLVSVVLVGGIALALLYGGVVFEPASLRIRGYRRPTMAEKARLDAALAALRGEMRLGNVPVVWVWDTVEAVAAARARSLVVSSALLAVAPDERGESLLRGVLAHELAHWRRADYLADRAVWAVGWLPLLMYRLGAIAGGWDTTPLVRQSRTRTIPPAQKQWFGVLIGWGLLWPAWLIIRLVMVPLSMPVARRGEYEADQAAAYAGGGRYLAGLREYLTEVGSTDFAVTGWQAVLQRTHPPVALRLEALEGFTSEWAHWQAEVQQAGREAQQQRAARSDAAGGGEPDLGPSFRPDGPERRRPPGP